jgi:5-(carboxyamino)imidazole ribonucleotide mutase
MAEISKETKPLVGILTGSPNDLPTVEKAKQTLDELGVPCEVRVLSAHRTPDMTVDYVRSAQAAGVEVFIACAGLANHLAGAVAAHTLLPVIGVPLASGPLSGLDSLLSTVQMPPGVPVATVAVDGTKNAGFLAARILSIKYPEIRERLAAAAEKARGRYGTVSSS